MSSLKKLASQTMWYGLSSIAARFINYLLTPYLTFKFSTSQYGDMSVVYAFIPFMNVIFTYGLETSFFRFSKNENRHQVFNTTSISIIVSTILLSLAVIVFQQPITNLLKLQEHPEYLQLSIAIIALDALSTIPFARLRLDGRPKKFAFIKVGGILVNIGFTYFFLSLCPQWLHQNPNHWCSGFFNPAWAVGYVLLANVIQSLFTFLFLTKEILSIRLQFELKLWKEIIIYSLPLIIAGFGGMINETFDRIMLDWYAPAATPEEAKAQVGIYSACYKLSILITLAVQAFRMGAEPFFFKQSTEKDAPKTYAKVMKFFVITLCLMFLSVVLYIDVWKHFIRNQTMWQGLKVVPILLLANMFLGIYYNLSVWYKLANKTMAGAWITIIGAAITLLINFIFIPHFSYMACAWATFFCYGCMMVISFQWGQKHYRIPYAWKKLVAYMVIVVLLFFVQKALLLISSNLIFELITGTLLISLFLWFILLVERKEFIKMPLINKLYKQQPKMQ